MAVGAAPVVVIYRDGIHVTTLAISVAGVVHGGNLPVLGICMAVDTLTRVVGCWLVQVMARSAVGTTFVLVADVSPIGGVCVTQSALTGIMLWCRHDSGGIAKSDGNYSILRVFGSVDETGRIFLVTGQALGNAIVIESDRLPTGDLMAVSAVAFKMVRVRFGIEGIIGVDTGEYPICLWPGMTMTTLHGCVFVLPILVALFATQHRVTTGKREILTMIDLATQKRDDRIGGRLAGEGAFGRTGRLDSSQILCAQQSDDSFR